MLSPSKAEIVALDASGVDRSRNSQRMIPLLQPLESSRGVEHERVALLALEVGERFFATFLGGVIGDDAPSREWRRRINRMRDSRGIGRHHQIPTDDCERSGVASQIPHEADFTRLFGFCQYGGTGNQAFIDSRNSSLVLVLSILSMRNSIASTAFS